MSQKTTPCLGFFNASRVCENCPMKKDCKFILVAVGFDIIRNVQSELMYMLPSGLYTDADRMPILVDQLVGLRVPEPDDTLEIFDNLEAGEIDLAKTV